MSTNQTTNIEYEVNGHRAVWATRISDDRYKVEVDGGLADYYMHVAVPFYVYSDGDGPPDAEFAAMIWVDLLGHLIEDAGTMP